MFLHCFCVDGYVVIENENRGNYSKFIILKFFNLSNCRVVNFNGSRFINWGKVFVYFLFFFSKFFPCIRKKFIINNITDYNLRQIFVENYINYLSGFLVRVNVYAFFLQLFIRLVYAGVVDFKISVLTKSVFLKLG